MRSFKVYDFENSLIVEFIARKNFRKLEPISTGDYNTIPTL